MCGLCGDGAGGERKEEPVAPANCVSGAKATNDDRSQALTATGGSFTPQKRRGIAREEMTVCEGTRSSRAGKSGASSNLSYKRLLHLTILAADEILVSTFYP